MHYHVGVEDMESDNWVAYVYELPGCFASARNQADAVAGVPAAIQTYLAGQRLHVPDAPQPLAEEPITFEVDEVFVSYPAKEDPEYLVNAMFKDDEQPVDIAAVTPVLHWNRHDLLELVRPLSSEGLQRSSDPRFGNIAGILYHIAQSEWWYCDRIGLVADLNALPKDPFEALDVSRANTLARLPELAGDTRTTFLISETWSPRKVLRRTLWHERDHINHITQILNRF